MLWRVWFLLSRTTEKDAPVAEYITEEEFEILLHNVAKKIQLEPENIRENVRSFLAQQGISVGLPLMERIRRTQVRAGEQAVLQSLRDKGLL